MKKVNCASVVIAALIGVSTAPAMASTLPVVQTGVNHQIVSVAPLERLALAAVSNQQQQQQSKKMSAGLKTGLYSAPNDGFAV